MVFLASSTLTRTFCPQEFLSHRAEELVCCRDPGFNGVVVFQGMAEKVPEVHALLCEGFVPTQFKATQLVVAIAVWAIPGGLSITYRFYFSIMHQNNIILLLDDNALFLLGNIVS